MQVLRYTAFSTDPSGGNPAGVVLDAGGATDEQMQAIATEVGYSETAFLQPEISGDFTVRYFSPLAEVPFCGHATIAAAVAYAERHGVGEMRLSSASGLVRVSIMAEGAGLVASLVSVPPRVELLGDVVVEELLEALRWSATDLDPALPVRCAYAGAWHPVVAAATRERLAALDYDYSVLAALMARQEWTTIGLPRAQSVPARRGRRGSGDRRGRSCDGCLPARARAHRPAGDLDGPPGGRGRPAEPAHGAGARG
jgi:PhzF family phenazine biosynthesis protein